MRMPRSKSASACPLTIAARWKICGPVVDRAVEHAALGDVAHFRTHAAVAEIVSVHHVEQHQFGNRLRLAVLILHRTARQQFARETLAKKARTAGNQYFHDVLCPCFITISERRSDTA
jgi:hypothetical protein